MRESTSFDILDLGVFEYLRLVRYVSDQTSYVCPGWMLSNETWCGGGDEEYWQYVKFLEAISWSTSYRDCRWGVFNWIL